VDTLRKHLVDMLTETNAHLMFEAVIKDFPEKARGRKAGNFQHTAWQLLEHLRLAQWDILEFSRNAGHESPPWPEGYWPENDAPASTAAWNKSVKAFETDLQEFVALIEDESNDLFEPFAHGDGQTLLREALVLAKHNSYHLGQLVALKKALA